MRFILRILAALAAPLALPFAGAQDPPNQPFRRANLSTQLKRSTGLKIE